jgi:hypothetical protein
MMTLTWNDLRIVRRIGQMERLPRGFAVAWWKENELVAIALPIGLHVVASCIRAQWHRFIAWRTASVLERAFRDGERHGLQNGYRSGYAVGYAAVQHEEELRQREIAALVAELRKEVDSLPR